MISNFLTQCLVAIALVSTLTGAMDWNFYERDKWGQVSDVCVSGKLQGPIELNTEIATRSKDLMTDPMIFKNWDTEFCGSVMNNGTLLLWSPDPNDPNLPTISGSQLPGTFKLWNMHPHWGSMDESMGFVDGEYGGTCHGSDHIIDYRSAPMEVHLLFYNAKYASFAAASTQKDGLAVLGFLLYPVPDGTPTEVDYSKVVAEIPNVIQPSSSAGGVCLKPSVFMPDGVLQNRLTFYRYFGGITAPPCYETVTFSIFRKFVPIPRSQLNAFRNGTLLSLYENKPLINTYRSIQPRNGRKIWINSNDGQPDDAAFLKSNAWLISIITMHLLLLGR